MTGPSSDRAGRSEGDDRYSGSRSVLVLYAVLVAVTAVAGYLIGTFVDGLEPPKFLFLVPFPATPLGFAAYGALTVALVLGIPLALVVYVSRNVDDPDA
ncbi:MAG: cox cluster protein [Haloferacaceae archaeon]